VLNLLQTRGSELCHAIVGPPRVRSHQSKGMRIAALHNTEMAEELVLLRAVVSSTMEFALGRLPNDTFQVEALDELIAKVRRQEEWQLCLERPGARVCDLIHGPPSGRARLANCMEEAAGQLGVEQAARREVNTKLEAIRNSAAWVLDLVLEWADGSSSLAASLSLTVKLLEGCIDVVAANGAHWGTRSVLATTLSHFSELGG
jgi:hypothetical protein